jgi:Protein of unknown function (DUF3558)
MMSTIRAAFALLMLSAVLAACGGSSAATAPVAQPSAPTAATSDAPASGGTDASSAPQGSTAAVAACALITEQDATTLLGSDPGPGMDTGTADAPACAYGASLTYLVQLADGKATFDTTKAAMQGSGKAQDLTGVGDDGFVFIVGNTIAQMVILKGSELLTVNVQGDPALQNITLPTLTTLGTAAAARF